MKDLPVFTCADGMASLIFREIPSREEGYVLLRSVFTNVGALVRSCAEMCRAAGAARVFCSGSVDLSAYPVHARLLERSIETARLPETEAVAVPIRPDEAGRWAALHDERFAAVPAAAHCVNTENAHWVMLNGECIGLGRFRGARLEAFATFVRGKGRDCLCATAAAMRTPTVTLLCAAENTPAMRLYDRLGFSEGTPREIWHAVTE